MTCKQKEFITGKCLAFDCSQCSEGMTLNNNKCMKAVLKSFKKEACIEALCFSNQSYSRTYCKEETEKLREFLEICEKLLVQRPWGRIKGSGRQHTLRKNLLKKLCTNLSVTPLREYGLLTSLIELRKEQQDPDDREYMETLTYIRDTVKSSRLMKNWHRNTHPQEILNSQTQPAFIYGHVRQDIPESKNLIGSYNITSTTIRIYEINEVEKEYHITPAELSLEKQEIEAIIKAREMLISEYTPKIIAPDKARQHFRFLGLKLLGGEDSEKKEVLADIFARYTAGYGLLEILFSDPCITDIYLDSSETTTPAYIVHKTYGTCKTNIDFDSRELERLSAKFRSIGGRPFDEANPLLDMELEDLGIRVSGIREPATFKGTAYAFRKRRNEPWTLLKLVGEKMMPPSAAALLGMLVDGQCSILVTGARGSGKTSLLCALAAEISQGDRIVLMEDTPEIPVADLRKRGWKIEHLRNQPALARTSQGSYERTADENLRAALRLGESILIIGEVRGPEARTLFEAMRVGAAGNSVIGTIHGSSPYDTWDRLTHDLNVPATSFKAVDVVVSLGYLQDYGSLTRSRYLKSITEVGRNWHNNPQTENGFNSLFDETTGNRSPDLNSSQIISHIASRKGIGKKACLEEFKLREKIIRTILDKAKDEDIPALLEIESALRSKRVCLRILREASCEGQRVDYGQAYTKWLSWFNQYSKDIAAQKVLAEPPKHISVTAHTFSSQ